MPPVPACLRCPDRSAPSPGASLRRQLRDRLVAHSVHFGWVSPLSEKVSKGARSFARTFITKRLGRLLLQPLCLLAEPGDHCVVGVRGSPRCGRRVLPGPGARYAGAVTAEPRLPSTPSWVRVMVPSG